jgi:hypothetical protein
MRYPKLHAVEGLLAFEAERLSEANRLAIEVWQEKKAAEASLKRAEREAGKEERDKKRAAESAARAVERRLRWIEKREAKTAELRAAAEAARAGYFDHLCKYVGDKAVEGGREAA